MIRFSSGILLTNYVYLVEFQNDKTSPHLRRTCCGSPWQCWPKVAQKEMSDCWVQHFRIVQSKFMDKWIRSKMMNWLVVSTPLKNMKVNGKDDIPYIVENKKCSKPPTSE